MRALLALLRDDCAPTTGAKATSKALTNNVHATTLIEESVAAYEAERGRGQVMSVSGWEVGR